MKNRMHTFTITHYSEEEEKEIIGTFSCQKQSILDQSRIARRKAELSGGMFCVKDEQGNPTGQGIDETTETINFALATLEIVLKQKPVWWDLNVISDFDLVFKVFAEVRKFEDSFRGRRRNADSGEVDGGSSEETSSSKSETTNTGNKPKALVDREVLATLDA